MNAQMDDVQYAEKIFVLTIRGTPTISFRSAKQAGQQPPKCKPLAHPVIYRRAQKMAYPFKTFTPATNRTGIPEAVEVIVTRHLEGEIATAVVLPPRYGKSDIIRLTASELIQTGETSCALALAPWEQIATQLVATEKMREMVLRYMSGDKRASHTPELFRGHRLIRFSDSFHETSELTHLFTATISLVQRNIRMLEKWISRCMSYGSRPIVMIDEGHLLSTANQWGKIAKIVEENNGHIVLLTGTPYRADGENMPGFKSTTIENKQVSVVHSNRVDEDHIEKIYFEGVRGYKVLEAHHTTTLADAWSVGAICKLEAQWVDADVSGKLKDKEITGYISEMSLSQSKRFMRAVVTDKEVIQEHLSIAIKDMRERRTSGQKDAAILIITASDLDSDGSADGLANYHARRVRDAIKLIDDTLSVAIATQAGEDGGKKSTTGKNRLKKFGGYTDNKGDYVAGTGDILIVKNMGTVGFDCQRVKTLVNLSTTRQLASWIQALLRVATTWGAVSHGTIVMPKDIHNTTNWQFIVSSEGGEYQYSKTELTEVKREVIKKKAEESEDGIQIDNPRYAGAEETHLDGNVGKVSMDLVHKVIAQYPIYRERMSVVEIMGLIERGAIIIDMDSSLPDVGVIDTGSECTRLASELEKLTSEYAKLYTGRDYFNGNGAWIDAKKKIYREAKRVAGIRCQPRKETDPKRLERAVAHVKEQNRIRQ